MNVIWLYFLSCLNAQKKVLYYSLHILQKLRLFKKWPLSSKKEGRKEGRKEGKKKKEMKGKKERKKRTEKRWNKWTATNRVVILEKRNVMNRVVFPWKRTGNEPTLNSVKRHSLPMTEYFKTISNTILEWTFHPFQRVQNQVWTSFSKTFSLEANEKREQN